MSGLRLLCLFYGVTLAGGGIMGYVKAQSPMSLYVGVTAGVLAVIAGVMAGKNPGFGFRLAGMVSLAMTLF